MGSAALRGAVRSPSASRFRDTTPICFNWQLKVYECFDEDRPTDKHSKIVSGHNVGLGVICAT